MFILTPLFNVSNKPSESMSNPRSKKKLPTKMVRVNVEDFFKNILYRVFPTPDIVLL